MRVRLSLRSSAVSASPSSSTDRQKQHAWRATAPPPSPGSSPSSTTSRTSILKQRPTVQSGDTECDGEAGGRRRSERNQHEFLILVPGTALVRVRIGHSRHLY